MDHSDEEPRASRNAQSSAEQSPHEGIDGRELAEHRPKYKSWRKKYRKMKARFDDRLKDNVAMYKTEQRLENIANRLQEQNDQLLDLLLDLNNTLDLPDSLRFNVDILPAADIDRIDLESANNRLFEVHQAIDQRTFPPASLCHIRDELEDRVASETAIRLQTLEEDAPTDSQTAYLEQGLYAKVNGQLGYMSTDYEAEYLRQVDAKLGDAEALAYLRNKAQKVAEGMSSKDLAEREIELKNPQSVHNWLKANKVSVEGPDEKPDTPAEKTPGATRKSGAKSLSRKVGDKAIGRAREREERSPMHADHDMEDDLAYLESTTTGSGRKKKGRDPDESYRPKGGGRAKPKRKRDEGETAAGRKKARTSNIVSEAAD